MQVMLLTAYVLIWPLLAAIVLAVLSHGVWKDIREAKREGSELV